MRVTRRRAGHRLSVEAGSLEATEHLQLGTELAIAGTSGMVCGEALHGLCTSAA